MLEKVTIMLEKIKKVRQSRKVKSPFIIVLSDEWVSKEVDSYPTHFQTPECDTLCPIHICTNNRKRKS